MDKSQAGAGRSQGAPKPKPRYDIYFSYIKSDEDRVTEMSERLGAVLGPTFLGFDDQQLVPGESELKAREQALRESGSLAVVLGPAKQDKIRIEERTQAARRSMQEGTRAFFVYLPGWVATDDMEWSWLEDRVAVDLRNHFAEDGHLTKQGLVRLIQAVRGLTFQEADEWLKQQEQEASRSAKPPAHPAQLRAMLVGIANYQRYPMLPSADTDVRSVEQLLRSAGEGKWEILPFKKDTRDALASAAKMFFGTGAGADDTLLFYFSGHGAIEDGNELYLVLKATDPEDILETAFRIEALAKYVKNSSARRKLVILDCCFSAEASDETDWGTGSAVFMTSRQTVQAREGISELTQAIMTVWQSGAETTGDLLDHLHQRNVEFHENSGFDRNIPLPATAAGEPGPTAVSLPAARLRFDECGDLYIGISPLETVGKAHRVEMASWDGGRRRLVTDLIGMIDAVVSLVPPEKLPVESVKNALLSLGADLLSSILTDGVRDQLGHDLDTWAELRLELSFDDRWTDRDIWERMPWESLLLCRDGARSVWLERIVRAKATKSGTGRRPSRVIAWNSFVETNPQYTSEANHLLTHLLRAQLGRHTPPPELLVKEPARWGDLLQASMEKRVEGRRITDFDTFLLFAPVSLMQDEPVVWFPDGAHMRYRRAQFLVERLREWEFSYLIVETVAGPPAPLQGTPERGPSQASSLRATTQLATMLARELGVTVVAICHLPSFLALARRDEGDDTTGFMPSFSGLLLSNLANPSLTLNAAAHQARRLMVEGLSEDEDSLDIGLPVVCRPEPEPSGPRPAARGIQPYLPAGRQAGGR
jgi:hypothetical protein